jgi:hypothetical protein
MTQIIEALCETVLKPFQTYEHRLTLGVGVAVVAGLVLWVGCRLLSRRRP